MNPSDFAERLKHLAPIIESAIAKYALPQTRPVANLDEGVRYALGLDLDQSERRGKRLRPALAVMTCEQLGGKIEQALPFAAAVELMHNYFLIHDDIEDGDTMRHGRPAVWRRFGLAHGINIGDYMHGRVLAIVLESLNIGVPQARVLHLLRLLADALDHTSRGQAMDMNARREANLAVEDYLQTVIEKTGVYLAAPMLGGAIVAGANDELLDLIRGFGEAIGPMFQIMDDLIDLTEGKGRGEIGADIREGKRSFMVAYSLGKLEPAARAELLAILDRPREQTSPADVARAIELMASCGAMEAAREKVADFARAARYLAAQMPLHLTRFFCDVADYLENRTR